MKHTVYKVTVEVLSPLHIGSGHELLRDIDYVVKQGKTWVVKQDQLMDRTLGDDDQFNSQLLGRPISELLQDSDYQSRDFFHYIMEGVPQNRPLKAFVKDVYLKPYLPGSTLKGLLRTIFLWGWFTANKEKPNLQQLGKNRSWAAQPIEREIMGRNPNEDFFRAVQVSDGFPSDPALWVAPVSIYPTGNRQSAGVIVDVESVQEGTVFEAKMTIDEHGFSATRLKWQDKRKWIDRLAKIGNAYSRQRLVEELEYYENEPRPVVNFYNKLAQAYENLAEGEFLAQLGWGAGWNSKTLNNLLTADEPRFAQLVGDYNMTRNARNFQVGDQFPKSRHILLNNGKLVRPMGWVLVKLEKITS